MRRAFRRSVIIGIAGFVFLGATVPQAEGALKIAIVDLQLALAKSKAGKKASVILGKEKRRLEEKLKKKRRNVEKLAKELRDLRFEISQKGAIWREEERERKLRILRERQRLTERNQDELKRLIRESERDLQYRRDKVLKKLLREVREVVLEIGREKKHDIILDKNLAGVLYSVKSVDITKIVIKRYNEKKK